MAYTARIDVVPLNQILILAFFTIVVMLAAVILGQTGPAKYEVIIKSSFNCPDNHHTVPCNGGVNVGESWMTLQYITRQLNKEWFLLVQPNVQSNSTANDWNQPIKIYTTVFGLESNSNRNKVVNGSETFVLPCDDFGICIPEVILYEDSVQYDSYTIMVLFQTTNDEPLTFIGDTAFIFVTDEPEFSKMALILKVLFLAINIALFAFHYLKLKGAYSYWDTWTDEQRLFVFLLIALVGYNNPFFPLEYIVKGWFLPFFGSFLGIVFTSILFSFWFVVAQKLRSKENKITWNKYLIITHILIVIYAIIATTFHGVESFQEDRSPILSTKQNPVSSVWILYFLTTALYVAIMIVFFAVLVISIRPVNGKFQIRVRFAFFSVPTICVILSILVGLFMGILGDFGQGSPSFVYFLVMFNLYVYIQLWGYWPVEVVFGTTTRSTEDLKLFVESTQPNYTIE